MLDDGVKLIDALMAPTALYVKPILALLKSHGETIHAMAHITGGGLTENIIRVIPDGLGLDIDAKAWTLPPVFAWLQREGAVADAEMWRTFNCGIGFVLIAAPSRLPRWNRRWMRSRWRTGASARWSRRRATSACGSVDRGELHGRFPARTAGIGQR